MNTPLTDNRRFDEGLFGFDNPSFIGRLLARQVRQATSAKPPHPLFARVIRDRKARSHNLRCQL